MKSSPRRVKKSNNSKVSLSSRSGYSRSQKAKLRSKQLAQRLTVTQAKKYILYAVICFFSSQVIKFLLYSVLFTGDSSPTGIVFLIIVYIQTGLLLFTFVFFVLAIFKALQRLFIEY